MKAGSECSSGARTGVIYCRVSDRRQTIDGDGLFSQEHRCREYAAAHGYTIEAVFHDDMTGAGDFRKRPGMVALLGFLEQHAHGCVVIFDDLKRFARDTASYLKLRHILAVFRATLECPNFRFEDTPDGEFIETVLAAQAQLERAQNRRQVLQKMKARAERGHYVFTAPVGYRYERVNPHGRTLVKDEPLAPIVTEALEGYASGRFSIAAEVRRWLETQPAFPKSARGRVSPMEIKRLLSRSTYAGFVEAPRWGIGRRKGVHEPLISPETFALIQKRQGKAAHAPARVDLNADFPLRGAVRCQSCSTLLTAAWCRGKRSRYPYYFCANAPCPLHRKTIRREQIENEFVALLGRLGADPALIPLARLMFQEHWAHALERARIESARLEALAHELQRQMERVRELIARGIAVDVCESRVRALTDQRAELLSKCEHLSPERAHAEESLEGLLQFLTVPVEIWRTGKLDMQRAILRAAFDGPLMYRRGVGFEAPEIAPLFCQQDLGRMWPLALRATSQFLS